MSHQDIIHDQFSRQAVPFSEARSMADATRRDGDRILLSYPALILAARVRQKET